MQSGCAKLTGEGKLSSAPTGFKVLLRTWSKQERTHLPLGSSRPQTVLQQHNEITQLIPPCQKQRKKSRQTLEEQINRAVVMEKGVQAPTRCGQSQDLSNEGKLLDGVISREKNGQEPPRIRAGNHPATRISAKICQIEQVLKVPVSSCCL